MITEQELEELINARIEADGSIMQQRKKCWLCDVRKNTACSKTGCILNGGPCLATCDKNYAYLDEKGNPVAVGGKLMDWASKVANI